jgi:bifunctional DNA-binding transcriptional regulator/antitoxin component of YhaV-PrlF toxin-antitoxin module
MMEKIMADERWRITIPKKFRANFRPHQEFIIEQSNSEVLILRAVMEKKPTAVVLERIKQIQLHGDPARCQIDAASVKDEYGARKQ